MSEDYDICYTGEIITRRDAKSLGLKRYFTNKPCKHGHISQRYLSSGKCCQCSSLGTKAWRLNNENVKGSCERYDYKELPDLEDLEKWFDYEQTTGKIFWKERPLTDFVDERVGKAWNTRFKGKEAGAKHYVNNYVEIRLPTKKLYKAQRIAWKLHYKTEPNGIIDHINGDPSDNRITNLRESSHQENSRNTKSVSENGYKGVTYSKSGDDWIVNYCIGDVGHYRRGFKTAEDAAKVYDQVVKELYGDFAFLNFPEEELL